MTARMLSVCLLLAVARPAHAAPPAAGRFDDVTVTTSQRRSAARSAAASVTLVDAADLALRGRSETRDLPEAVPNLVWQASAGASVPNVYLRGIGSASIHSNQQSPVALNVDDVTFNAPLLAQFGLHDLERVEVLRGVQPAEFGRAGSGGVLKFVPRAAEIGTTGGTVSASVGSQGRLDAAGSLNLPTSARTALRLSLASAGRSDFVRNRTLGVDEGDYRRDELRAQWAVEHGDTFRARLTAHAGRFAGDSIRYKQVGLGTPGAPGRSNCPYLAFDRDPGNGCTDQTGYVETRSFGDNGSGGANFLDSRVGGGTLRVEGTLGGLRLTSLSGFVRAASRRAEDTDGGPSVLFVSNQQTRSRQWSQELRVGPAASGAVDWQLGAYAFGERARYTSDRRNPNALLTPALVPGVPIGPDGLATTLLFGDLTQRDDSRALYARVVFPTFARGRLDAQLRWSRDRKRGTQRAGIYADRLAEIPVDSFIGRSELDALLAGAQRVGPGPLPPQCPRPFPLARCYSVNPFDGSAALWSGRLAWSVPIDAHVQGYAAVSHGAKGPAIGPISVDVIVGAGGRLVPAESVWSVEVGAKSEWFQRTLRVDAALFHSSWHDYQLYLAAPAASGGGVRLASLPRSRSSGGELEAEWLPAPHWRLSGWAAWTDTRVQDAGSATDAVVGSALPGTPRFTAALQAGRDWALNGGRLTLAGEWYRSGPRSFGLARDTRLVEAGYGLLNASARYTFAGGRLELSAWGRNLAGARYCILRQSLAGLGSGDVIGCAPNEGEPVYGITVAASY